MDKVDGLSYRHALGPHEYVQGLVARSGDELRAYRVRVRPTRHDTACSCTSLTSVKHEPLDHSYAGYTSRAKVTHKDTRGEVRSWGLQMHSGMTGLQYAPLYNEIAKPKR
jgi:hypothetical protein